MAHNLPDFGCASASLAQKQRAPFVCVCVCFLVLGPQKQKNRKMTVFLVLGFGGDKNLLRITQKQLFFFHIGTLNKENVLLLFFPKRFWDLTRISALSLSWGQLLSFSNKEDTESVCVQKNGQLLSTLVNGFTTAGDGGSFSGENFSTIQKEVPPFFGGGDEVPPFGGQKMCFFLVTIRGFQVEYHLKKW